MKKEHRFYINGEWIDSSSTELIEIENPSTEEVMVLFLPAQKKI